MKVKQKELVIILIGAAIFTGLLFTLKPGNEQVRPVENIPQISPPEALEVITDQPKINDAIIPIMMYHHVGSLPKHADKIRADLTVTPANFDQQMAWLQAQGFKTITLADLVLYTQGHFTLPGKPVIITFDDGYSDAFEHAIPILQKYNFTGSFGIITQWVGKVNGTDSYASWDQIKQAYQSGMDIVSHTQSHFDGTSKQYNYEYIYNNLKGSREDIASNLGTSAQAIIYPYGHYDADYIRAAQEVGFKLGLTGLFGTEVQMDKLMEVPRVRVHGNENIETFAKVLTEALEEARH